MNVRLMVVVIFALFVMPLFFAQGVSAFAENPIPYWDDDSQGVDVSWDSVNQTVEVAYANDSLYWEDMSVVTDWDIDFEEATESISTDGDIGTFSHEGDGVDDMDYFYSNSPDAVLFDTTVFVTIRYRMNTTDFDTAHIYLLDHEYPGGGAGASDSWNVLLTKSTDWQTDTFVIGDFTEYLTPVSPVESVLFRTQSDLNKDFDLEVDFWRIWTLGDLDIGVPLIQQPIQSVEFMGNFSALNSTVRFQMYDDNTASGLWCDVNSTQVTFPDASYAEFTNIARINFSLNEEIRIFTIYVAAADTTLINYYSEYAGLANKDYLRMTDSAFNGSYQLLYFLEEVIDMPDNIFYLLFLSLEIWGYLGPLALVVIGYILAKKDRGLGLIAFIVQCLFAAQYFVLIETTPAYWWHVIIILVGGILTCVVPLMDKR